MRIFYITMLTLFCTFLSRGQILHRQTLSNNGVSTLTKNGVIVSQTIGQSISSETVKNSSSFIQQGFQQSLFAKLGFDSGNSKLSIETKVYPNPFISFIKVDFSDEIQGKIEVRLIDMLGRVVFLSSTTAVSNSITIDSLDFLPAGSYYLSLSTYNYKFNNQLIKN